MIAKAVLDKGLDSQTAYEIVSIDIADIDVGDNVGARLMADQAEADMRIARAKAEERRANAVAREQEMRALTKENQAAVVMAEAEIPKAMAEAYRNGTLRAKTVRPESATTRSSLSDGWSEFPGRRRKSVRRMVPPLSVLKGEARLSKVLGQSVDSPPVENRHRPGYDNLAGLMFLSAQARELGHEEVSFR